MPLKARRPVVMNHRICTLIMSLSEPSYYVLDFQTVITVVEIQLSSAGKNIQPLKSTL